MFNYTSIKIPLSKIFFLHGMVNNVVGQSRSRYIATLFNSSPLSPRKAS